MEKMIGVINNNLRTVIEEIKTRKKEIEDALATVKATMDDKVNAANEYKKSVDEARDMITSLEGEIKDLESDLEELTIKFGDKDFKELLTAGNREINTKIIEKRALINAQSEKIKVLTEKARELKDALVDLKDQKTSLETAHADILILEQYYEARIMDIIEVAEENPNELANYVNVRPQDLLNISSEEYDNIDLKQIIDGSIFQEIDAISSEGVDERLVQEALHKNLTEASMKEEVEEEKPAEVEMPKEELPQVEPLEEEPIKKEVVPTPKEEELVDIESVEPFKPLEPEEELEPVKEATPDIELKPLELDLGEIKESEPLEEEELNIPSDIFNGEVAPVQEESVQELEKEYEDNDQFPWMNDDDTGTDEDLGMDVLTIDNTEVDNSDDEEDDTTESTDSSVASVLEIPNSNSEPENDEEVIDLHIEEELPKALEQEDSPVIDLDFENNDGMDFANAKVFNDELPKSEDQFDLNLSEVGLEEARFNEENMQNLKDKYNKENVLKTLAVLNSHQLDVQTVYQDSKILTDITSDKLDKIISLLETTGATSKDINAVLPLLYKVEIEALSNVVKGNPTGELSEILYEVVPYNGENGLPSKLGLTYTEETSLRQSADDVEFKKLNLFADIVEANYINLNSYKIANIRECITKHPKRFLMNPSRFNEILDKYDPEDLVRCVNKNAAVIDRL